MRVRIADDVRLFVELEGTHLVAEGDSLRERPTLIAIHGGPGVDHAFYRGAFGPVAEHAQILMYDQRASGRSDHGTPDVWNLATWADDVVRLCDVLGIVRPIVYGTSFGGVVALAYATRHPTHASGVILDGAMARFSHERVVEAFRRAGGDEAADAAYRFWSDPRSGDFPEYVKKCISHYHRKPTRAGARPPLRSAPGAPEVTMHWAGGEWLTFDLRPGLAAIECPVMIFSGGYDPIIPIESAREVAAQIPNATIHEFPDNGHGVMREEPERAHELMVEFIATLDG